MLFLKLSIIKHLIFSKCYTLFLISLLKIFALSIFFSNIFDKWVPHPIFHEYCHLFDQLGQSSINL